MTSIKHILIATTCCVLNLSVAQASKADSGLVLSNSRIEVQIDRQTGGIRSIINKELGVQHAYSGIGFEIQADGDTIRSDKASKVRASKETAVLSFESGDLNINLHYRLGPTDHFVEKWAEIQPKGNQTRMIQSVVLEEMKSDGFSDIHFHDDQTIWSCPINLFLRSEKGGCFAGLAYPYWDLEQRENRGFRLGYTPNDPIGGSAKNKKHVSEIYFLGVYRNEGIHRVSQGPYPGRGRYAFLKSFGGLKQHFKNGRLPKVVEQVPVEVLDWGEVWAMQEFMEHVLPNDLSLPEEGYWVWQNGWWAKLYDVNPAILDRLKEIGIHDIMTAHTWYGRGVHPNSPPYIQRMRTEPLGFPQDLGTASMPGPGDVAKGFHADQKAFTARFAQFKEGEYTDRFVLPPAMDRFHKYGKKIGVHVSSFSVPAQAFDQHPEWLSIDDEGKPNEYLFARTLSSPANDEYMDHMFELLDHVFTTLEPRWWGFDGRWLSYWEVGAYRKGPKGTAPDPSYAKDHGHPPGDGRYQEWKNIMGLLEKLRTKHPKICLETYYGLQRGGPWALRHLDSGYHYFETYNADLNRMQAWHQQNGRFRPVYKNSLDLFGKDQRRFRFNLIAGLGISSYCMVGSAYQGFANPDNREFFMKWRKWASDNHAYLTVKRDLFGCPGDTPLDGSAHIIKDRGYLFLNRGGFDMNHKHDRPLRASIPLNRWIQLDDKPETLYQVKEVYPREGKDLGIYKHGEDFLYDMPDDPAVILSIEPAKAGSQAKSSKPNEDPKALVIPAFTSIQQP